MKVQFTELSNGLMMTEAPLNPRRNREKMAELALEHFQAPKFQISMQSLNAIYAEGLLSGLVLESGEGISTCVPVAEGFVLSHAIQRLDIGGRDINEYLMELLKTKILFTTTFEKEFARDIKEQCCAIRTTKDQGINDKSKYCLPDGKIIELVSEKY
jgi:actin, other eukaryote